MKWNTWSGDWNWKSLPVCFHRATAMEEASRLKLRKMASLLFQLLEAVLLRVPSTTGASLNTLHVLQAPARLDCLLSHVHISWLCNLAIWALCMWEDPFLFPPSPSTKDLHFLHVLLWSLSWNCLLPLLNFKPFHQHFLWYLLHSTYYFVLIHFLASLPDYKLFSVFSSWFPPSVASIE